LGPQRLIVREHPAPGGELWEKRIYIKKGEKKKGLLKPIKRFQGPNFKPVRYCGEKFTRKIWGQRGHQSLKNSLIPKFQIWELKRLAR